MRRLRGGGGGFDGFAGGGSGLHRGLKAAAWGAGSASFELL
jgi:hypothetical protein